MKMSRRPTESEAIALIESLQLEKFRTDFPEADRQIRELVPLKSKSAVRIDELLLEVARIVSSARSRRKADYTEITLRAIRASKAAEADIKQTVEGLLKLDVEQLQLALNIIGEAFPDLPLSKSDSFSSFFHLLAEFSELMMLIHHALRLATGQPDEPKSRGRPRSNHILPAFELMNAWESSTAVQLNDVEVWERKRIPVPKGLGAGVRGLKDEEINSKQPSTIFIGVVMRLIESTIKDSEVFTAIKHALELRDIWSQFIEKSWSQIIRKKMPARFLLEQFHAVSKFETRPKHVRKKPI
jgi:hypothetical protein